MAALKKHQTVYAPMSGDEEEIRIEYDFAEDAGATGALDIATAGEDLILVSAHARVLEACTSEGSATLEWGDEDNDDRFANTTQGAVANLTKDAVIFPIVPASGEAESIAPPVPFKLASGKKLVQTIGTAALTAGKVQYVIRVRRP